MVPMDRINHVSYKGMMDSDTACSIGTLTQKSKANFFFADALGGQLH